MNVWRKFRNSRQSAGVGRNGIVVACSAIIACLASPVAALKTTVGGEVAEVAASAADAASTQAPPTQASPIRELDIVIVIGFRLRSAEYDLRMQSVISGYAELVEKADCVTSVCGFVVVREGTKWRATNVVSGQESELRDKASNMEREGTTLVIVHPSGVKRTVPKF